MSKTSSITSNWQRLETVLLWLLLCTPLIWDPWAGLVSLYKWYYINLTACLLVGAFLLRPLVGKGFSFSPSWFDLAFALFFIVAGSSLFWAVNEPVHLKRFSMLASAAAGFYLVRIRMAEGEDPWRTIRAIVVVAALVSLVDSAFLVHTYYLSDSGVPAAGFKVDSVLFIHHNVASLYAVGVIPLAYSGILLASKFRAKLLYTFCLLAVLAYLGLLKSKAAWIESGLAIMVVTAGTLLHRQLRPCFQVTASVLRRKWVLVILIALMVTVFLLPMSKDFSSNAKAAFMRAINVLDLDYRRHFFRLDIWRKTLFIVADNPVLGVGLGNFPVAFPAYHKLENPKSHPHSEYFNVLVELGVVGMVFYTLMLVLLLRAFLQAVLDEDRIRSRIALGLGCALLIEGVHGLVEPPSVFEASGLNLWIYTGLLLGLQARVTNARVFSFSPGGTYRRILIPVAVLAGLVYAVPKLCLGFTQSIDLRKARAAIIGQRFEVAEQHLNRMASKGLDNHYTFILLGDACLRQGKHELAVQHYQRAAELFPHHFKIYWQQGVAYRLMGEYEAARDALHLCLEYNPGFDYALVEMIKTLFQLREYDEAFPLLRNYLRSKKPTVDDLKMAGQLYLRAYADAQRSEANRLNDLKHALVTFEQCQKAGGAVEDQIQHIRNLLEENKQ